MSRIVMRGTKHVRATLLGVVCMAVVMLALGLPTAAARGVTTPAALNAGRHTIIIGPTGSDDTANIQGAFNVCTNHHWTCTIELRKGTYYTAQIATIGFQGSFVGAGQGQTVIQALPNLPPPTAACDTGTNPFWTCAPGPQNSYPVLLTFVNAAVEMSGMTISEPYANPIPNGWGTGPSTFLDAMVLFTGLQEFVTVDHVTMMGGAGTDYDFGGTNVEDAFWYQGLLLPPDWSNYLTDMIPVTGTFSLTQSSVHSIGLPVSYDNVVNGRATVCFNSFDLFSSNFFADMTDTSVVFCANRLTNVGLYNGFSAYDTWYKLSAGPSTVYVLGNYFQVGNEASPIDVAGFQTTPTLSAVISGNVGVTDTSCGCYDPTNSGLAAILSYDLESAVISNNVILGGVSPGIYVVGGPATVSGNVVPGTYVGVWVDYANGVNVLGNVIKNSSEYGIAVTDGSSYNTVAYNLVQNSGVDDLYWDETGANNVWVKNICSASSPTGLC